MTLYNRFLRPLAIVSILVFFFLGSLTYLWMKDIYIENTKSHLLNIVKLTSINISNIDNLNHLSKNIKQLTDLRITIINSKGMVIAESIKDKDSMDNHREREEIKMANNQSYGFAIRESKTLEKKMMYVAKIFQTNQRENIYIRVAQDLNKINSSFYLLSIKVVFLLLTFILISIFIIHNIGTKLQKETDKILNFLTELTNKNRKEYISSDLSKEFIQITKLLTKVSTTLSKKDRQKAKYTTRLKLANTQKDDIISAISHEFKNPISIINGYSQTILDDDNLNKNMQKKFLTKILNNSNRLSNMIDRLRLSIQLEDKKQIVSKSSIKVNELIKNIISDLMIQYPNRIIKLNSVDTTIEADKVLISIAISNLIENALKYSEDDIEVLITQELLSVTDKGVGISKKDISKITDKFYRVSKNIWNNSLGIGLSLVVNILKLHKFELSIISEINRGSKFTILFKKID